MSDLQRATDAQTRYFYDTLRTMASGGALPDGHPLKDCPADPFAVGATNDEKKAVQQLHALTGNWSYDLRRLWYGYRQAGRLSALHAGIGCVTIYDEEMRQLLRSHPDDEEMFPQVHVPDNEAEARFKKAIQDSEKVYEYSRLDWRLTDDFTR